MTTSIDTKAAAAVAKALTIAGTEMTFTSLTSENYDTDTGDTAEVDGTPITVKVTPPGSYRSIISKDGVPAVFFGTFVPPSVTPVLGMKVQHGGKSYDVVRVEPIYSGDDVAIWEVELNL